MPRLTKALLEERWSQPAVARELTQTATDGDRIVGYSDVYVVSPARTTFHGIASATPAARQLIRRGRPEKQSVAKPFFRPAGLQSRQAIGWRATLSTKRRIDCS